MLPPASTEEQLRAAREIVLRQLSYRAHSREQLRGKLASRGVEPEIAEQVLDRFTEVGLVDDAAFAEWVVRSQRDSRGLSRRALAVELHKRGVDGDTAASALTDVQDDYETALRLAQRKLEATAGLERAVRERRIAGMLARKGYGAAVTFRAVMEALDGEEPQDREEPQDS